MGRWHAMALFFTVSGAAGCQQMNRYDNSTYDGFPKITFQVNGMMKAKSGAT